MSEFWQLAREMDMPICGSRGPRIGDEGQPVCKLLPGHPVDLHQPDPEDGWEQSMYWIGI